VKISWSKIGSRSYKRSCGLYDAFLFGATRPVCLWAWSVYWRGGHSSWVENSFREAKKKAEECIEQVLVSPSPRCKPSAPPRDK